MKFGDWGNYTTEALIKEWGTLAMLADDNTSAAYIDEDEDALANIKDWEKSMEEIEAELNRRGVGLHGNPVPESWEDIEANGTTYRCWHKLWLTSLGNAAWGVTDMKTGLGVGGFTKTLSCASYAIWEYIESLKESKESTDVH